MKYSVLLAAFALLTALPAGAATTITLNFGSGEFASGDNGDFLLIPTVDDSTAHVTGVPAGVSFGVILATLPSTPTIDVGSLFTQTNALGINAPSSLGSDANAGIDNFLREEGLSISIGNVAGLAPGESMYISGLELTFLQSANGDSWEVNNDGVVTASSNDDVLVVPNDQALAATLFARNNPSSTDDPGDGNNRTAFGLASLELTIVPEPSTLFLAFGALPLLMRRRR